MCDTESSIEGGAVGANEREFDDSFLGGNNSVKTV